MNIQLRRLNFNVENLEEDFQNLVTLMAIGKYRVVSTFTAPDADKVLGVMIVFEKVIKEEKPVVE